MPRYSFAPPRSTRLRTTETPSSFSSLSAPRQLRVEAVLWRCPYEAITAYDSEGEARA